MTDAVSLSRYLREGTADVHREAERSTFVTRFVQGKLDRDTYARHLRALHPVYTAMEEAMESVRGTPRLAHFCVPALWRSASLVADLQHLRGPDWKREEPVASARRYAERLQDVRSRAPVLLVAHCYVRYLGDLSGGQVLGKLARQHLGLDGHGASFYEFREIADPSAFKNEYRRRLDELPLDEGEREALLEEARRAFGLNASIFEELVEGTPS